MAQNGYDGFERRVMQWLDHDKRTNERFGFGVQQPRSYGMKFPSSHEINSPRMVQRQWKCSQRPPRRNQTNRASSGPGMQAIFLGSGPRSCGTGVFIPRTEGDDHQFSKKPAFSPVLLPARVVQALNLNVHELGHHQIKPQTEQRRKNIAKKDDEKLEKKKKKKKGDDIYISPDIILPEEWTY